MGKVFTITAGLENMGALKTGGQGSVYKGRRVGEIITAVKLLPTPIHSESPEDKHYMAFQNEVAKLRKVNEVPNPHVVRILSSGLTESGSFPFIEMDFVEGPDLEELLKAPHDPVFTIKEAVRLADQLSNALAHCHRVGVKHGDVKSNNVKYNVHTGNYVLLDFGMAIMSDEQRRTSLRHAGAIEFMAPEQNNGEILFQTDVYSFGVILFELVAGSVPFPLSERGETARTQVMLAHMEAPPPDLMELRRRNLPAGWSEEKQARELQVPQWLIDTVYICLQKAPQSRFSDGMVLHDHIVLRSTQKPEAAEVFLSAAPAAAFESELQQLRQENEELRRRVQQLQARQEEPQSYTPAYVPPRRRSNAGLISVLLVLAVLGVAAWLVIKKPGMVNKEAAAPITQTDKGTETLVAGQYMVKAARAYFYDRPDAASRRNAYMVPSSEVVNTTKEDNGFVYTDFVNSRGQRSRGWLRVRDLMTLDQWNDQTRKQEEAALTQEEINRQLTEARSRLESGQLQEALFLYQFLAAKEVPEAMYEYGNLGLQGRHSALSCKDAFVLVQKASDKRYVPAKRTLGFLYVFADNPEVLRVNNYDGCTYDRDVFKGSKLLLEAAAKGDEAARKLVEEFHLDDPATNAPNNNQQYLP
ncbi:serine/threonine protein kinase [Flaviaesturariibacter flavus]|uniref:Serine/threonine protein kinase n=1 Tax=Flaviaesturariibacter flavus TaxID=2502780 RepID=A0A4R1B7Q3_9BACT|nr:protein kinase [Flaviaesturariibacter flavus]TCJ12648.1 serine/threonine protein kinase [Flaviaesturariibacter flavus]